MEERNSNVVRKGFHKHVHVSKLDSYICGILSFGFFVLVAFKFFNRIFEWGMATSYITWVDAMQLAVLWAILSFAFQAYYDKYERKYDE